jgi:carboxylesterase
MNWVAEPVDAAPFDLPAQAGEDAAALCIHGLTGTPYEVRPLAAALAARGFRARGPLLPGHGTRPEELARLKFQDWVEAVHREYEELRSAHARVVVVGLSLGGLLSLELASRTHPDAIAVVGTPLAFGAPLPQLVPIVKYLMPMLKKREGSDILDPEARARHPGYSKMPLASVHELIRLQRRVAAGLGRIKAPALVAHGAQDRTAQPGDARRILDGLGSAVKESLICADSGHVVPVDHDGEELAGYVADFMVSKCSGSVPSDGPDSPGVARVDR